MALEQSQGVDRERRHRREGTEKTGQDGDTVVCRDMKLGQQKYAEKTHQGRAKHVNGQCPPRILTTKLVCHENRDTVT